MELHCDVKGQSLTSGVMERKASNKAHKRWDFGRWLQDRRQRSGYPSGKEFAGRIGITPQQLSRIENGVSGVSAETLDRVIDLLCLNPLEAYMRAGLLPTKLLRSMACTVEQALDATLYWEQKGLDDGMKSELRLLMEALDAAADKLSMRLAAHSSSASAQSASNAPDEISPAKSVPERHVGRAYIPATQKGGKK